LKVFIRMLHTTFIPSVSDCKIDQYKERAAMIFMAALLLLCKKSNLDQSMNLSFTTSFSLRNRHLPRGKSFLFNPAKTVLSSF
jgi:hypothetical protein